MQAAVGEIPEDTVDWKLQLAPAAMK